MGAYRTGKQYADKAKDTQYDKLKYSDVDCQAFCEKVLKDIGVRKPDGGVYDWRGSNDMARNATSWIGTIEQCKKEFGSIPLGAWAFMWDNTGNEKQRGYYDGKGNYSHVGIYVGAGQVRDSTKIKNSSGGYKRDGVAYRSLNDFQRIGLCKMLDFDVNTSYNDRDKIVTVINEIRNKLDELERMIRS